MNLSVAAAPTAFASAKVPHAAPAHEMRKLRRVMGSGGGYWPTMTPPVGAAVPLGTGTEAAFASSAMARFSRSP
jgi:hypothetical protein